MTNLSYLDPFHIDITSGPLAVREAISQLKDQLTPLKLGLEEAGTFEIVLAEALNNVVEHGYEGSKKTGPISIDCAHKHNGLHIQIVDSGLPMPNGKTPLGLEADLSVDAMDLPEGGFGWFLIKDLAKDIHYERSNGKNCLNLRIAVAVATA